MNIRPIVLMISAGVAGCTRAPLPEGPRQGTIAGANGGASGYQHGIERSLLVFGGHARRVQQSGYLKQVGDEGSLAINLDNGSAFGIPNAKAPGMQSPPYGKSPEDHDGFVKTYFVRLGIPGDQIARVRTMTLLEANGRTDEKTSARPAVTAYYSVLERAVEGIPIPDSFAWARVNAESKVVGEAVYWPALSREVVEGAKSLRDAISDKSRRSALEAKIPGASGDSSVAIRHSSAWINSPFDAFPCLDVTVLSQARAGASAENPQALDRSAPSYMSPRGQFVVRHVDANGVERFLPQERRNLASQIAPRPHNHPK